MNRFWLRPVRWIGFWVALVSYYAPWVAHKAAGLSLAEQDLAEFPKFMPQVRDGDLTVVRELFYSPLLVLSVALVIWAAHSPAPSFPHFAPEYGNRFSFQRWLMRLCALVLPFFPTLFHFFEPAEFAIQQTFALSVLALILLTPIIRRVPPRVVRIALTFWFVLAAGAPAVQYILLKPALETIYNEPLMVGWGVWAGILGFGLLAIAQVVGSEE